MFNFVTVINQTHLTRALALAKSLERTNKNIMFYIVALDQGTESVLEAIKASNIKVIPVEEIENKELLQVKLTRKISEYCWTLKPFMIDYLFKKHDLDMAFYVDSDLYFYHSFEEELIEFQQSNESLYFTPHNFAKTNNLTKESGYYCAQMVGIKNNQVGNLANKVWAKKCIEWCHDRCEKGLFADQKYLEHLQEQFNEDVLEASDDGIGVAPWNLQKFRIAITNDLLKVIDIKSGDATPITFFHFHGLQFYRGNIINMAFFKLDINSKQFIYLPYLKHLQSIREQINKLRIIGVAPQEERPIGNKFRWWLKNMNHKFKGTYNQITTNDCL